MTNRKSIEEPKKKGVGFPITLDIPPPKKESKE